MSYYFSEEKFRASFNAKSVDEKSADSMRLTHKPDNLFKLFPYKASGKTQAPIVTELEDVVSGFFREALGKKTDPIDFESLCTAVFEEVEVEKEDMDFFKDMLHSIFFVGSDFVANDLGLYPYQTATNNKSAENLSHFLFSVFGINKEDCKKIENAKNKCKFNVLEEMVIQTMESKNVSDIDPKIPYFCVKTDVQRKFKSDFYYMLEADLTSLEDLANLFAVYYFYYVSQTCITLDHFCDGKRENKVDFYFALDWEKISKKRLCCESGWDKLQGSIDHMFSHAITLEILNQTDKDEMWDYISFGDYVNAHPEEDSQIANEIKRAENVYKSYVGDYKKFDEISCSLAGTETEKAIKHLYECVKAQFLETDRRRANQFYNEKYSEFCKSRWVKNRRKSGLVLNLTERDIIFLTKISLRNQEKIRLNDLYKEYEKRGIYLDNISKEYLQDFFIRMNLIDKKSDSGDALYVKRIL